MDGRSHVPDKLGLAVDGRWAQTGTVDTRTIPVDGLLERVNDWLGDKHAAPASAERLDFSRPPPLLPLSRS